MTTSLKPRSPPSTNTYNKHVQFTVESEKGGSLLFLDVLLSHKSDGSIWSTVYRKRTHTDRYLNFSSHHPIAHKKSTIMSLFYRPTSLTSSLLDLPKEQKHITRALRNNGYPTRFIGCSTTHTFACTTSDELMTHKTETTSDWYDPVRTRPVRTHQATARMSQGES